MSEVFFGGGFIFAAASADGIRVDDIERCAELAGELDGIETANGQMVIFINVNMRIKNHFFSLRFAPPLSAKLLKVLIKLFQKFAGWRGRALLALHLRLGKKKLKIGNKVTNFWLIFRQIIQRAIPIILPSFSLLKIHPKF